jgi:hypothetical protein
MTDKLSEHQKFFKETKEKLGTIIDKFGSDKVYNSIEMVNGVRERRGISRIVYIPVSSKERGKVFLGVSTAQSSVNFKYPLLHQSDQESLRTIPISEIPAELKKQYKVNMIKKLKKLESKLGHFNVATRESQ